MKTKVVYVLTSNGNDRFAAMLSLSLATLRHRNHDAEILVIMDAQTHEALKLHYSSILHIAKPVIVDVPSSYNQILRSRFIKTNLREIVQGDFLFIDVDTLIAGSLYEIDFVKSELAFVTSLNQPLEFGWGGHWQNLAKRSGFEEQDGIPFFNGGVFIARDTPFVHSFFAMWHECWNRSIANSVPYDQPALHEANRLMNHPIQELPGIWNCQFGFYPQFSFFRPFVASAKILHYYTTTSTNGRSILKSAIDRALYPKKGCLYAIVVAWPQIVVWDHFFHRLLWMIKKKIGID